MDHPREGVIRISDKIVVTEEEHIGSDLGLSHPGQHLDPDGICVARASVKVNITNSEGKTTKVFRQEVERVNKTGNNDLMSDGVRLKKRICHYHGSPGRRDLLVRHLALISKPLVATAGVVVVKDSVFGNNIVKRLVITITAAGLLHGYHLRPIGGNGTEIGGETTPPSGQALRRGSMNIVRGEREEGGSDGRAKFGQNSS